MIDFLAGITEPVRKNRSERIDILGKGRSVVRINFIYQEGVISIIKDATERCCVVFTISDPLT